MKKSIIRNETFVRVRYSETDQMGYCYYGNYAQYCEVGRVEALRELGMAYKALEEKGVMLPVSEFNIRYKRPAKYDDLIKVVTLVRSVEGVKIVFDYELYNESGDLLVEAMTKLVFVAKENMRPTAPPKEFMDLINQKEL
jgi:acyl-CoA thioester hydrolase